MRDELSVHDESCAQDAIPSSRWLGRWVRTTDPGPILGRVSSSTSSIADPDLGDPLVTTSLNLGWEVTELICRGVPRAKKTRPTRADLATLSDLLPWEITEISLTAVEADIHHLAPVLTQAGLDPPSTAALREAFGGEDSDKLNGAVTALHYELMRVLHAADFRSGQAYDLGRALAYTVLKPHDVESLRGRSRPVCRGN